jgi:hypothetical protein
MADRLDHGIDGRAFQATGADFGAHFRGGFLRRPGRPGLTH